MFARIATEDDRDSLSYHYAPKLEIKDFNVLIDGKRFFDLPVKNEEEAYKKVMSDDRNNDYRAGSLLDFGYFKKNYKLIAINLSKQSKLKDPQLSEVCGVLKEMKYLIIQMWLMMIMLLHLNTKQVVLVIQKTMEQKME